MAFSEHVIELVSHDVATSTSSWRFEGDRLLFAAVEFMRVGHEAKGQIDRMLTDVVASQALVAGAGEGVAAALVGKLAAAACSSLPTWVFFASALVTPTEVELCWAGPIRIHLTRDGRIVESCREHVLTEDPPASPNDPLARVDVTYHGSIATRSIGLTKSRGVETRIWRPEAPYRVVICSTDAHGYRDPSVYAGATERLHGIGWYAVITRRSPGTAAAAPSGAESRGGRE